MIPWAQEPVEAEITRAIIFLAPADLLDRSRTRSVACSLGCSFECSNSTIPLPDT